MNAELDMEQLKKFLVFLRKHLQVIGWIISDIKGISPIICMHRILIKENCKPVIKSQKRLNPNMKEVVGLEILKWLDASIIFPIFHSV